MDSMSRYQRVSLLMNSGRAELAANELRRILLENPNDGYAHAYLSLCLSDMGQHNEATSHAREAIANDPALDFAHFSLGRSLLQRNRPKDALEPAEEAVRLDHTSSSNQSLLSQVWFALGKWKNSLDAAEQGLQYDPEDEVCSNLRNMALRRLGQSSDAEQSLRVALEKAPESSLTHANLAWSLLEQGKRKEALKHFEEALRLDPNSEYARNGMITALRATFWPYRILISFFAWMQRLPSAARWAIMLGGYFGVQQLDSLSDRFPAIQPFVTPIVVVYLLFAVSTWIADPLLNIALCFSRYGRRALNKREKLFAMSVASILVVGVIVVAWGTFANMNPYLLFFGLLVCFVALLVAGVERCEAGWPRTTAWLIVISFALVAIAHGVSFTARAAQGTAFAPEVVVTDDTKTKIAKALETLRPEFEELGKKRLEQSISEPELKARRDELANKLLLEFPEDYRQAYEARARWRLDYQLTWEYQIRRFLLPIAIAAEIGMIWLGTVVVKL
jgi:tetratricopeptide (TPR) repeat protein